MIVVLRVQVPDNVVRALPGLANDRPKRATVEGLVVWYDRLGGRIIAPHDDVAANLSSDRGPRMLRRRDAFPP